MPASPTADAFRMVHDQPQPRPDWVCVGHTCWRGDSAGCALSSRLLHFLGTVTSRVAVQRWVRYRIDLAHVPASTDEVRLTPLNDELVAGLRSHPDHAQEAFASGLAFWDYGIHSGFVWREEGESLCFQWLLSETDVAKLRARSPWANMYPPLPPGTAQLEKLWTFSTARKKGIASRFALAMFDEARRRGIRTLVTHIHEANEAARSWAQKTGWRAYGSIERFDFDVPVVRKLNFSICAHLRDREAASAH